MRVAISPFHEFYDEALLEWLKNQTQTVYQSGKTKITLQIETGKKTDVDVANNIIVINDIDFETLPHNVIRYVYYLTVHHLSQTDTYLFSLWVCDMTPWKHQWEKANQPPDYWEDEFDPELLGIVPIEKMIHHRYDAVIKNLKNQSISIAAQAGRLSIHDEWKLNERLYKCCAAARRFIKRQKEV